MHERIVERLRRVGVLVSDGAWGTELIARGLDPGMCPELWNIEHAQEVLAVARSYVEAGADLITTNSFGGTQFKLAGFGLEDRAAELNQAAARLSREAAGDAVFVAASMGPTGKLLLMGEVSEAELTDAFAAQAVALAAGGADACLVETMSALDEGCVAVRAAKENTSLEVICTFTFDRHDGTTYRTMMGVSPAEMAAAALDAGADIIGANCSLGAEELVGVVEALRAAAPDAPIMVQPNAGRPVVQPDGATVYPETPEFMAACMPKLLSAGADIVGGCCGSTPAHIRAMAQAARRQGKYGSAARPGGH